MTARALTLDPLDALTPENVHLFEYQGEPFVFVIPTTRSFALREETAYLLRHALAAGGARLTVGLWKYTPQQLLASYAGLQRLNEAVRVSVDEMKRLEQRLREEAAETDDPERLISIVQNTRRDHYVYITRRCNLACSYCWNDGGRVDGEGPDEPDDALLEAIADFIIANSGERKELEVIFFGGEPLFGIEKIAHFAEYARRRAAPVGKEFRYLLDTNGTIWNDRIAQVVKEHRIYILVSLDGAAETHNPHRPFRDGRPSHHVILANVARMLRDVPGQVGARAVLGDPSYSLTDTLNFLRPYRFQELQVLYYSFAGFSGGSRNRVLGTESVEQYRAALAQEVNFILQRLGEGIATQVEIAFLREMKFRLTGTRHFHRCYLGRSQMVFQTNGRIYPCLYLNDDRHCLGDVYRGIHRWDLIREYGKATVFTEEQCRHCWARFACGGCCLARNIAFMGDPYQPIPLQCERLKEEVRAQAYLASRLAERGVDVFNRFLQAMTGELPLDPAAPVAGKGEQCA